MTVLVGVRCSDGVVIGADSAATSAIGDFHLLKMASDKIVIVGGRVIVAGTGQIGLAQRFAAVVRQAHDQRVFQKQAVEACKTVAAMAINDFGSTAAPKAEFGAMMAAPMDGSGQLVEFAVKDLQPEIKSDKLHFVAMGSGQALAEPFMSFVSRTFWGKRTPDVKSGIFGVHWALSHTIQCAPGGVGEPIVIAKLMREKNEWKAELVSEASLGEQKEHMAAIEERISAYRLEMLGGVEAELVPKP